VIEAELKLRPLANLHFHFISAPKLARLSETLHYILWQRSAVTAARKLCNRYRFDAAHHVTYASIHVPTQLWRTGIPLVFGPVGGGQTAPSGMLYYFASGRREEQLRTIVTRYLSTSPYHRHSLARTDHVLAANHDTLNAVTRAGCRKASLMCDTAVSEQYLAHGPLRFNDSYTPLKLLWAGRMLTRKALPLALDALREVRAEVTLTIAGDGIEPNVVHGMIADRNLRGRVFWKGSRLEWSELRDEYADHHALLFTSLRDSFGSQVLEAMAMGLPVIALDLHGVRDHVPARASIKVPVDQPEETVRRLALAIEKFASLSRWQKCEMSREAWSFAKTQTWAARAEFAENLYRELGSRVIPMKKYPVARLAAARV